MVRLRTRFMFPILSFGAGFCLMGFEILSSRIIAPLVGASLISWTSVIGITLLGLSLGAYIGGVVADRYPPGKALFYTILASVVSVALVPWLVLVLRGANFSDSLVAMSIFFALIFFLIPSLAMGAIQPIVLKSFFEKFQVLGKEYGLLSMMWSLGSILGVFGVSFLLIPHLPVTIILVIISGILLLMAFGVLVMNNFFRNSKGIIAGGGIVLGIVMLILVSVTGSPSNNRVLYQADSPYYHIQVADVSNPNFGTARGLFLDFDSHSIETEETVKNHYTTVFPAFGVLNKNINDVLVIGAGAYTMPKKISEWYPSTQVSVVELDPALEQVGEDFFDLDPKEIATIHQDARFFMRTTDQKYDVIFGDAYNSFISVPWYLATQEFYQDVASHLNPGGIYGMSFMASKNPDHQSVIETMYATFHSVFPVTYVMTFGDDASEIETMVLLGSRDQNISSQEFKTKLKGLGEYSYLSDLVQINFSTNIDVSVMRDNHAPLEHTMVKVMKSYYPNFRSFFQKLFFS